MKKGDLIEGIVREVKFPNKGIVETEDGICVVKNAITGQKVQARVNKKRKGKAEAALISVLERSPLEKEPPCPAFGICGGCTFLSLPYEEQCGIKEQQVRELLAQALPDDADMSWFEGILPSPDLYGYRNKMEFSFGDSYKDGPLALGMHKRGSFYDIVNADCCAIGVLGTAEGSLLSQTAAYRVSPSSPRAQSGEYRRDPDRSGHHIAAAV